MLLSKGLILMSCLALLFTESLAQTGSVAEVLKDGQARVVWDPGTTPPPADRLGVILENNRPVTLFRVLNSKEQATTVQFVDVLMPRLVSENQQVRLIDPEPSTIRTDQTSIVVWSDRMGNSLKVDGKPAGQAPARVILPPGAHEVILDLPDGVKAGAKLETRLGEEAFVCLHGKGWSSPEEKDGLPYYVPFRAYETLPGRPLPLMWLENRQRQRVYDSLGPVKKPTIKKKVMPRYPESARLLSKKGLIMLDAVVGPDGRILQVDAMHRSDPGLIQAAREAVLQWVFEPATIDEKPVSVFYTIIVEFY